MADLAARYPEVDRFAALMLQELAANSGKGDQDGWRAAEPDALLNDITWHWAKLAMAWRDHRHGEDRDDLMREYAADVANMSMMFLDRLGLLPSAAPVADAVGLDDVLDGGDLAQPEAVDRGKDSLRGD